MWWSVKKKKKKKSKNFSIRDQHRVSTPEKGPSWQLDNSLMCKLDVLTCVCFSISSRVVFPVFSPKEQHFQYFLITRIVAMEFARSNRLAGMRWLGKKKKKAWPVFFFKVRGNYRLGLVSNYWRRLYRKNGQKRMVAKVEIGLGCEYCCKFLFLLSDVVKCHTYPVREFRVGVLGCLLHSRDISPSSIRSLTRRRLDQTLNSVCVFVSIFAFLCV